MKAAGADVIVVLSHNGNTDGGYGYGFTVDGDQTLAKKLVDAGHARPISSSAVTATPIWRRRK